MGHKLLGGALLLAGAGLAFAGWKVLRRHGEQPKDFHGNPISDVSGLRQFGGMSLLFLGLMLAMIFAPLFYLG